MVDTDQAKLDAARVVAFVHAKGTSERLPGKNLKILGDRPLICHAIRNALEAKLVDAVVIDSDHGEILRVGEEAGAIPLSRPMELASNETTGDDLAHWQASNVPHADIIVQVVPTSPFISPRTIDQAIKLLDIDSVIGVRREKLYLWALGTPAYAAWQKPLPNSNDLLETTWETTGLYVVRRDYAYSHRRRFNRIATRMIGLTAIEAIDINTAEDFAFAEIVWKGMAAADWEGWAP